MSTEIPNTPHERLRLARERAGFRSASEAARAFDIPVPTYVGHENGTRNLTAAAAQRYAALLNVTTDFLLAADRAGALTANELSVRGSGAAARLPQGGGTSGRLASIQATQAAAALGMPPPRLPVFGLASAGEDGRFLMNGQKIAEVMCPPMLIGVPDAYAAYVHGESMVPRYESGETVWVNPHVPPRRRDYVLAQIATDDPTVYAGYVKRLVSFTDKLVLEQFNPPKELPFKREEVISLHKIVFAGES